MTRRGARGEVSYWRSEAERYRNVLEWLEENTPAALDLCPFKAPTNDRVAVARRPTETQRGES